VRLAPLWVFIAFLVLGAVWLKVTAAHAAVYPDGCALDFGPQGLSQARAYLAGPGGCQVELLTTPLVLAALPSDAVLLRVAPQIAPFLLHDPDPDGPPLDRNLLSAEEDSWVASGGRLVLAVTERYGPLAIQKSSSGAKALHKVFPALPGVKDIAFLRPISGTPLAGACTIFAFGDQPAVVRMQHGSGEVWMLSCPQAFFNQQLARGDHLRLLLGLVAGRPLVVFDEYAHGVSEQLGFFTLLRQAHLGPALALVTLSGVLWFHRRRVLVGPVTRHALPPSTEAVDGVAAIGALYARALSRRELLTAHHQRLVRRIQERHPGPKERALTQADQLLDAWRPEQLAEEPSPTAFRSLVRRLNRAFRRLTVHP